MKISRRKFLRYTVETGITIGAVGALGAFPQRQAYIRPPRSIAPDEFTAKCIRCSVCVEVCPTKAISLKDLTLDLKNISTPEINPEFGGCIAWKTGCNACADACPTGAIDPSRSLENEKIATVTIDQPNCVNCMVCFQRCPIEGAVLFPNPDGAPFTREKDIPTQLKLVTSPVKPYIDNDKCTGCGLCAFHCPKNVMHMKTTRKI